MWGARMAIFEPTEIVLAEGEWRLRVKRAADVIEYITHDRAMNLADELEAEGWRECASQIRKALETVRRFQAYARP